MNLLKETVEILSRHGKSPSDVEWIGNASFHFSWDVFLTAANADYNNGYGGHEVAADLLVVGKDFWLERHEYDGSEWWEYKEHPPKPSKTSLPETLFTDTDNLKPKDVADE